MKKTVLLAIFFISIFASVPAYFLYDELNKIESNDPLVWDETITEPVKRTEAENPR